MRMPVTREEAVEMDDAHIDGYHDEIPRQFCPSCENRPIASYPTEQQVRERKVASVDG